MTGNDKKFDKKGAGNMDKIAKTTFAPVYPAIADKIIERFNITKGVCIDLGNGPAPLAIALAKKTSLKIISFDKSEDMQDKAGKKIEEAGLGGQISILNGDVHKIPLENSYADLIISPGSIFFWDDLHTAFREIYRVLKPGGKTYIGGGFGSKEIFYRICSEMEKNEPDWSDFRKNNLSPDNKARFSKVLEDIKIPDYEVILGDEGIWIIISKSHPEVLE